MFPDFDYVKPQSLQDALVVLREMGGKCRPLAGGTALLVDLRDGHVSPDLLVDIGELKELRFVRQEVGAIGIGAATTLTEIQESPLIREMVPFVSSAAASVGGPPIRNRATVGGNLLYASPGADMVPSFIALGATFRLVSDGGERMVPAEEFYVGPRKTVCGSDELLAEIRFPVSDSGKGAFIKLGLRNAMAIALASVGLWVEKDGASGIIREARVALGALGPTPMRARVVEDILRGERASAALIEKAADAARNCVQPRGSSIRSSGAYRKAVAGALVKKALEEVLGVE